MLGAQYPRCYWQAAPDSALLSVPDERTNSCRPCTEKSIVFGCVLILEAHSGR